MVETNDLLSTAVEERICITPQLLSFLVLKGKSSRNVLLIAVALGVGTLFQNEAIITLNRPLRPLS